MSDVLSIIVPIYNRKDVTRIGMNYLEESIAFYQNQCEKKTIDIYVVVIDDGSTDGSDKYIRKYHPKYKLLKGDGTLWWSGAINKGVLYALEKLSADYILLWNDDTQPAKNYFCKVAETIINIKNQNMIIGSIILDVKTKAIWSAGGRFNLITGRRRMMKSIPAYVKGEYYEVDWLPGMGTLVPKSVIKKNGYWDKETFPQYFGDTDFTLRAKRKGVKNCICPELIIYNFTEHSTFRAKSLSDIRKALTRIGSIYNIEKTVTFYLRHMKTPLWVAPVMKNYLLMLFDIIKPRRRK